MMTKQPSLKPLRKQSNGKSLFVYTFAILSNIYFELVQFRLDSNSEADAEEMKEQKKKLEDKVQPIITKLYAGSEGGDAADGDKDKHDKDEL